MDKAARPVTGGTPYKVRITAHRSAQLGGLCFHRDMGRWRAAFATGFCPPKSNKTDKSDKKE